MHFANRLVSSAISSTVFLTIFFLFSLDLTLVHYRPLQYVTDLRFIPLDQHPMVAKIPVYLESAEKVNLLILGSSLPMCGIAEYDQKKFGRPNCKVRNEIWTYLKARYIEEQLSEKLAKAVRVSNLSIVSCMASDTYIILSHSVQAGKKPGAVVLCMAPRDFVDNIVQPFGQTPPFEVLQDWKSLNELLKPGLTSKEMRDLLISAIWYYYRVKVDYRTVLTLCFSEFLSHPTSLYYASRQPSTIIKKESSSEKSAGLPGANMTFPVRYNPPNFKRFAKEMEFFAKLLSLCKTERIQCVVVNMPVTVSHQSLLDSKLNQKYILETRQACHDYGAWYFDFNDQEFVNEDFSDGFHLNALGSEKFQNRLVDSLLQVGLTRDKPH